MCLVIVDGIGAHQHVNAALGPGAVPQPHEFSRDIAAAIAYADNHQLHSVFLRAVPHSSEIAGRLISYRKVQYIPLLYTITDRGCYGNRLLTVAPDFEAV